MTSENRLHPASFLFRIGARLKDMALPLIVVLFSAGQAGLGWQVWLLAALVPYTMARDLADPQLSGTGTTSTSW